jgi:peptidoglycan/LPS O-acetylase OafA/YrhL
MFGKYSYCLYIVHYPLMLVIERIVPRLHIATVGGSAIAEWAVFGVLLIGTSLAMAWVSWRTVEGPMLSLKRYVSRSPSRARSVRRSAEDVGEAAPLEVG